MIGRHLTAGYFIDRRNRLRGLLIGGIIGGLSGGIIGGILVNVKANNKILAAHKGFAIG